MFLSFAGTLPSTLCQARSLSILSLDGLTASSDCVDFLWDPLQLHLTAGTSTTTALLHY
jgi:hypothetical protein